MSATISMRKSNDPGSPLGPLEPCGPRRPLSPPAPTEPGGPTGPRRHRQKCFFRFRLPLPDCFTSLYESGMNDEVVN